MNERRDYFKQRKRLNASAVLPIFKEEIKEIKIIRLLLNDLTKEERVKILNDLIKEEREG